MAAITQHSCESESELGDYMQEMGPASSLSAFYVHNFTVLFFCIPLSSLYLNL